MNSFEIFNSIFSSAHNSEHNGNESNQISGTNKNIIKYRHFILGVVGSPQLVKFKLRLFKSYRVAREAEKIIFFDSISKKVNLKCNLSGLFSELNGLVGQITDTRFKKFRYIDFSNREKHGDKKFNKCISNITNIYSEEIEMILKVDMYIQLVIKENRRYYIALTISIIAMIISIITALSV